VLPRGLKASRIFPSRRQSQTRRDRPAHAPAAAADRPGETRPCSRPPLSLLRTTDGPPDQTPARMAPLPRRDTTRPGRPATTHAPRRLILRVKTPPVPDNSSDRLRAPRTGRTPAHSDTVKPAGFPASGPVETLSVRLPPARKVPVRPLRRRSRRLLLHGLRSPT
jgi:hypothetical protein